tara:strand:+ start:161 stop:298 length:138 start_codon:yes stop_codon:yes gene_type:complete
MFQQDGMGDYTTAIFVLVGIAAVLTTAVVYVLVQPTDLPMINEEK